MSAVNSVLGTLDTSDKFRVARPINATERRQWANPELYVLRNGLRLEEGSQEFRDSVLKLLQVSMSPAGYEKAISAMRINHFLGEVVGAPGVLNEYSYNFLIFGTPSKSSPFGWLLFGHHLCLSAFIWDGQIIFTPTFTGAEPNIIDSGPYEGTQIMSLEQDLGHQFMCSLPPNLQEKAQIYKTMEPPEIPLHRFNPADQRHLCGAFQDNRIVPYEGVNATSLSPELVELLITLVEQFVLYLPDGARQSRLQQVREHINDTYFSWIGFYGETDPFYYRIQSPVIICEFDHHSGVFLSNTQPARFHIHTVVRSPNGGDYGYALLKDGVNCP